jgi:hypothetical protein
MTMPEPKGPFCQSCGMPLSRDSAGGGTNSDGTRSREYCSRCFEHGRFTEPNISMYEMMEKVEKKLRRMHLPALVARKFAAGIPKLSRWDHAPAGHTG